MMNKSTAQLLILAFALLAGTALAAGGAVWWYLQPRTASQSESPEPLPEAQNHKYVSLDKVIVMLRAQDNQSAPHFLALDLVFKSSAELEKKTKEHLPLLRAIAVKALSAYTVDTARALTIEQFTAGINRAYSESYARERQDKPFTEAMIGKLIIE
ncbi:MAG: Flagellar basal body-associated protein FliL [Rhodocyclaceae bacterium]|nr:Flagellar basal body-associated protein FliL [Rhodocyclaceae bacterium]